MKETRHYRETVNGPTGGDTVIKKSKIRLYIVMWFTFHIIYIEIEYIHVTL